MSDNDRVIKSYVWHGDTCFFVSTIERGSSAVIWQHRYNETIVWAWDWLTGQRGAMLHIDEDRCGSIEVHEKICALLYKTGECDGKEASNQKASRNG
jgi:hypothetical protein